MSCSGVVAGVLRAAAAAAATAAVSLAATADAAAAALAAAAAASAQIESTHVHGQAIYAYGCTMHRAPHSTSPIVVQKAVLWGEVE